MQAAADCAAAALDLSACGRRSGSLGPGCAATWVGAGRTGVWLEVVAGCDWPGKCCAFAVLAASAAPNIAARPSNKTRRCLRHMVNLGVFASRNPGGVLIVIMRASSCEDGETQ
jgi:hypothetical protein